MGYDIRFYVVNKLPTGEDLKYGQIVAMYDYCQDYNLADFIDKNSKPTDTYIYVNEKETIKDCYGDLIKDIELDSLLEYLHNDKEDYRRKLPLIKLLEGFKEVKDQFNDLRILMYGH